jgi:hypothetical protein
MGEDRQRKQHRSSLSPNEGVDMVVKRKRVIISFIFLKVYMLNKEHYWRFYVCQ